jgi:hypothetical protein
MAGLEFSISLAPMIRVGLAFLSILAATAIVVGASYGAAWLEPHLQDASPWPWLWSLGVLPAAVAILLRRKRRRI